MKFRFRIIYDKHHNRYFLQKNFWFFFWDIVYYTMYYDGRDHNGEYGFSELICAKRYLDRIKDRLKRDYEDKLSRKQKNRISVVEYINFDL